VRKWRKRSDETAAPAEWPVKMTLSMERLASDMYCVSCCCSFGARALVPWRKPACAERGVLTLLLLAVFKSELA
jgi:hypothetical protein